MKTRQSTSYGIIPCVKEGKEWKVFLIQHHKSSFWGFPKGHAEKEETPLEAAKRELFEETGLFVVKILQEKPILEKYIYKEENTSVEKKVIFHLAETSTEFTLDHKEIVDGKWLKLAQAKELISYKEGQELVIQVESILKAL